MALEASRPPAIVLESAHLAREPSLSTEPAPGHRCSVWSVQLSVDPNVVGQLDFREAAQHLQPPRLAPLFFWANADT